MSKKLLATAALATTAMLASACGGGDDAGAASGEVTVALPFASCLSWYPLYVAEDKGYFKEEGVKASFEATDGSGGAVQATLTGKAELAAAAPNAYLAATATGAGLQAFYALYQKSTFSVITTKDSGVSDVAGLKGKKIGISAPGGGDVIYQEWLASQAGLKKDADYSQLAVGDGSSAATALKKGTVDAYSASFFDEEVIKSGDLEVTALHVANEPQLVDNFLVATDKWAKANTETIEKVGRALARGTEWGLANPDGVIEICGKHAPEETEDPAFAKVIYDRVSDLLTLPESAQGKYGHIDTDGFGAFAAQLADLKLIDSADGAKAVTNDHVEAWNSTGK
ncbi:ABC transporter substrate-binding protein [Actinocorallia sp. A-T 12471]|uniref:ABC transporter substrate-binding protein n=1 Tax=Actinocorallia sp. A-T 12471 TaxID=3089813 RepID=UPI0029D3069D|nr:ABC transporter substrate-binding protein [Actinocorallia sp. A-T 12471]MDX6739582.1 ABC transporter substrate-binding protein [Actinocorallia sp. A-T 12471]